MAKNDNLTDFLTDIANTIRTKKGTNGDINPQNFSSEIASIQTQSVLTGDAVESNVLSGKTFYKDNDTLRTGTMPIYNGSLIPLAPTITYTEGLQRINITDNSSGITGHRVYVNGSLYSTIVGSVIDLATDINVGGTFTVSVKSVAGEEVSDFSNVVTCKQLLAPSITLSGNVVTIANPVGNGSAVESFTVHYGASHSYQTTQTQVTIPSSDYSAGSNVVWACATATGYENSPSSNTLSLFVPFAPTIALSSSAVTITDGNTASLISGYNIYSGTTKLNTAILTSTSVDLANYLTADGTYTITVKAVGTNGVESSSSNSVSYVISSGYTVTIYPNISSGASGTVTIGGVTHDYYSSDYGEIETFNGVTGDITVTLQTGSVDASIWSGWTTTPYGGDSGNTMLASGNPVSFTFDVGTYAIGDTLYIRFNTSQDVFLYA